MAEARKVLSVVVPVFRNAGSIAKLHERLAAVEAKLGDMGLAMELIFVDDGSDDASLAELMKVKAARPATTVVKLTRNFGETRASRCGLRFVKGDCFSILAADLQDPPELILDMARAWHAGAKFVICERESRDDPATSKAFSALYYKLIRTLVMRDYPAGGYDLALMDAQFLPYMRETSKNLYTPLLAVWLGCEPHVIKYHRERREHGESQWSFAKKIGTFVDVMLGFSVTPLRWVSALGLAAAVLSFVYGVYVVFDALLNEVPVPGWTSIVALISFLFGLVIVMLGLIGEYLWRIFDELNKRPEVVIDEVY